MTERHVCAPVEFLSKTSKFHKCISLTNKLFLVVLLRVYQNPDGSMKMTKLIKKVVKSIKVSGIVVDEATLDDTLQEKVSALQI